MTPFRAARRALVEAKAAIEAEMQDYPTPVAGCDAQYTALLSERSRVIAALRAMDREVFVPTPRTLEEGTGVESR